MSPDEKEMLELRLKKLELYYLLNSISSILLAIVLLAFGLMLYNIDQDIAEVFRIMADLFGALEEIMSNSIYMGP